MVITSLTLRDYRNYNHLEVEFNPGINFIIGKNGQGKTNLIESLYFLTHLKSFRSSKISDLCFYNQNRSTIGARFTKRDVSNKVKISINKNLKQVLLNRKKVGYRSEYIKLFFSILFAPDQLTIFGQYPRERRNFFDRALVLMDTQYFQLIKKVTKISKQKAFLLRQRNINHVLVWNRLLSRIIPLIIESRERLVSKINNYISEIFSSLTGRKETLKLCYQSNFEGKAELEEVSILSFLSSKAETERDRGHLCYGPHKDNFWMTINDKKDSLSFSRGEYRASFLALQLSINKIIFESLKFCPILLLDDVFSELDRDVSQNVLNYISRIKNQVFITSTEAPLFTLDTANFLAISNGKITR